MIRTWSRRPVTVLLCVLLLVGCAQKVPVTEPLAPELRQEAMGLFAVLLARRPPATLDADIRVTWEMFAAKGGVDATIQLQQPARLRFAANDPLGRSLFLVVSDGRAFTLVDNRVATVYQGNTDSTFWRARVPEAIQAEDLLLFLAGSVAVAELGGVQPAGDGGKAGFWFAWMDARGLRHHVLLDRRTGRMLRHLLDDHEGDRLLDLGYAEDKIAQEGGFAWPGRIEIQGEALDGTVAIRFDRVYPGDSLSAEAFQLVPPPHFTVERVD